MLESTLEKRLTKAVKEQGGLCIKLPANLYKGIPDRMILLPKGRIYFVELKVLNGRVSVAQNKFLSLLNKLGFNSGIIRGKQQLEEFINHYVRSTH
jgi:hypothetical protein